MAWKTLWSCDIENILQLSYSKNPSYQIPLQSLISEKNMFGSNESYLCRQVKGQHHDLRCLHNFIVIVSLGKIYHKSIITLASTVFKKCFFPNFPHFNGFGIKFGLDGR